MRVRAKGHYYYAGHQYSAGDEFEIDAIPTDAWIRPLLDLGVLERVEQEAKPQEALQPGEFREAGLEAGKDVRDPQAAGTVAEATGQARGGDPSVN